MRTVARSFTAVLSAALGAALAVALLAPPVTWAGERILGSGPGATEIRQVGPFEAIHLAGSIDLTVRQGEATSVSVTADDNLLAHLETSVEAGAPGGSGHPGPRLVVRWRPGSSLSTRGPVRVQVVTPRLVALSSVGSGDARIEAFDTPRLELTLTGSGGASLHALKTDLLQIAIAGSGDVRAEGRAQRLKVRVAGSGDVQGEALRADDVNVGVAGSGDVAVQAWKTLAVSIAGSGDVAYSGDAVVKASIAGSGTVRRR